MDDPIGPPVPVKTMNEAGRGDAEVVLGSRPGHPGRGGTSCTFSAGRLTVSREVTFGKS